MNDAGPIVGRLRRPTWRDPRLLIGVALIALSVVAVSLIVRSSDATAPFYAARDTLPPGTVVSADDLVVAHVRVSAEDYVAADGEPPVGAVVTRTVGEGELVPASALTAEGDAEVRAVAVTTALPLDGGIGTGSVVDVWLTTLDDAGQATTVALGEQLVVTAVEEAEGAFAVAGDQVVHVAVPRDDVAAFLQAIASGGDVTVLGSGGAS
ncbi:SAF domain-containing protein [Demequina sp. NBRC 110057]|uniref:SAF domain-containing protein n=1 Tax=Demequina sp. NBRC 110057 TaxID=1570346 RepID=UPI000A05A2E6|nr:SAF domain-containing protein [Demequina sp. NBRC 110057]